MKNFLSILLVLFLPIVALAGNGSGNVSDVFTFGGGASNTSSNGSFSISKSALNGATGEYFMLDYGGNPTDGTCSPFRKNGAIFQAGSNGTLCVGLTYQAGGNNNLMQLFSATATYANNSTCSSQTGPVYQSGVSGNYTLFSSPTAGQVAAYPQIYKFSANTWPGAQFLNGGSVSHLIHMLCKDL